MSSNPSIADAELAFQEGEHLANHLGVPPAANNVTFNDPPVEPNIFKNTSGQYEIYSPAIEKNILDEAKTELPKVMDAAGVNRVMTFLNGYMTSDIGPNIDILGGEDADVLSFDSAKQIGDTVYLQATERLWTKDGHLVGTTNHVYWHLISGTVYVTATMQQGSDGLWRSTAENLTFAPGSEP